MPSAGRKKALIIGCTYPGSRAALGGCVNDALCVEYLLRKNFGFEDIRVLRDDRQGNQRERPTRQNILAHIRWLVGDAKPGDSLFFHFSGAPHPFRQCCRGRPLRSASNSPAAAAIARRR